MWSACHFVERAGNPCIHTMSTRITILYYGLWFAQPLLELSVAALLVRRGLHRKFKYFFGYLLTQVFGFATLIAMERLNLNTTVFMYLYWCSNAVSVGFGFGVIHEVFVDVFRSFHTLRDLGTVLFKWAGLVMLLVAGVVSISTNSNLMPPWMEAILTAQRCVRIIQLGLILFLLFFARYLGVSRRQQSFGIALGFGGFAAVELALLASFVGNHLANPWMSIVNMTAYNCTLGLWLGYAALKNPVRDATSTLLQTQRWEHSLSNLQHQPLPTNSLIPMFEGMVDRALSRTQPELRSAPSEPVDAGGEGVANTRDFQAAAVRAGSRS